MFQVLLTESVATVTRGRETPVRRRLRTHWVRVTKAAFERFRSSGAVVRTVALLLFVCAASAVHAAPPDGLASSYTITPPSAASASPMVFTWEEAAGQWWGPSFDANTGIGWYMEPFYDGPLSAQISYWDGSLGWVAASLDITVPAAAEWTVYADATGWGSAGFLLGEVPPPTIPEPAALGLFSPALLLLLRRRSTPPSARPSPSSL